MTEPANKILVEKEIFSPPLIGQEKHNNRTTSSPKYGSHANQYIDKYADLEFINKQLLEMKERLMEDIYKVHLLQVDLATQFNPYVVERIRSSETSCGQCAASITDGTK